MTETEACKILGVSVSASFVKKEQSYKQKQRKLQLSIAPGNSQSERKKAWKQLAELTGAWHVLKETHKIKPSIHIKPQTLGQLWETLVSLVPIPEPVIVFLVVMVGILVILGLLKL